MKLTPNDVAALQYDTRLSREEIFAAHLAFGRQYPKPTRPRWPRSTPLRVGYVSADFFGHACSCFLRPLIAAHDRRRVQIFLYSNVREPDVVTEQFKQLGEWRPIRGVDDETVIQQIAADRIDILLDCTGLTAGKRHELFARGPAPVTVSFLGYPDTTGLAGIDYRLTDEVCDPMSEGNAFAAERLVRLPNGYLCFDPITNVDAAVVEEPPCLKNGFVTFGSFNRREKANDIVLRLWADVLRAVPNSRLVLKDSGWRENPMPPDLMDRVTLLPREPKYINHFGAYRHVDIALDTFPYNGTTTTCDALWMGVPVLTLKGDRHCARVTESLLTRVGLYEYVATSAADFVARARYLAQDTALLAVTRKTMRERIRTSALGQPQLLARDLESWFESVAVT